MPNQPPLAPAVLRGISEVLGETQEGLTNAEIDRLLSESSIPDPTPRGTPGLTYVAVSKLDRLERALNAQQQRDERANRVLRFVRNAMAPVRFRADPERFEQLREELNVVLARDPNQDDRVWVLFDWNEEGFQNFLSDPEVPAIIQEAGHKSRPQAAELGGQYDA